MGKKCALTFVRIVAAFSIVAIAAARANADADTVFFVVRHCEKETEAEDTPLSADGKKRAEQLAQTLQHLRVAAIYRTKAVRATETAAPLAEKLGITPVQYTDHGQTWVDSLVQTHKGKHVLIVGHSDTVPQIVSRLTNKTVAAIGNQFDNLFIVVISDDSKSMVKLKYGKQSDSN